MKQIIIPLVLVTLVSACSAKENPAGPEKPVTGNVEAPSEIVAKQVANDVLLSWKDNSDNESGFEIYMKDPSAALPMFVGKAMADSTRFAIEAGNFKDGKHYVFGVKAISPVSGSYSSEIAYSGEFTYKYIIPEVSGSINIEKAKTTYASIAVTYSFSGFEDTVKETGLCWSETRDPSIADPHFADSKYIKDTVRFMTIPNAVLDLEKTYHIRAYAKTSKGIRYSEEVRKSLAGQPDAITFNWTEITPAGFPAEVKAYKTSSTMDGDPINAWYAIADISTGKVGVRANLPSSGLKTLENQWTSDCLVMTNGGYFYGTSAVGLCVIDGSVKSQLSTVRGTLRHGEDYNIEAEYNTSYPVTRGAFCVDNAGNPSVSWNYNTEYYSAPVPHVVGEQRYEKPSVTMADWRVANNSPKYAIGAGPMLVKDGKVQPEVTVLERGMEYFINNTEVVPYDIYNTKSTTPDRTAIGITADGKVVLFVCDGRIKESKGASIVEVAQIMKGLGCVDAVNMDGGGSTAMLVDGKRVNSTVSSTSGATENRPVATTWCFFKK